MIPFNGELKIGRNGKCGYCGRKINDTVGCRKVRLGWYCMQCGLIEDPAMFVHPDPDPRHEALKNDPELLAAALLEAEALKAFELVDGQWSAATVQLYATRSQARGDEGEWTISGGWRPSKKVNPHAAEEKRLAPKVDALAKVRERRGEDLHEARVAYARTINEARGRHGLAVGPRQSSAETNTIIPS